MGKFASGIDLIMAGRLGLLEPMVRRTDDNSRYRVPDHEAVAPDMKKIYLAHPYSDKENVERLLQPVLEGIGLEVINPFQRPEQTYLEYQMANGGLTDKDCKDIVAMDLKKIRESDAIVASLTADNMIGTLMEIFYCAYVLGNPVFAYAPREREQQSPWIREHAMVFTSQQSLITALKDWVNGLA